MLNAKEREFFILWLIAYGQDVVDWSFTNPTPMDRKYTEFTRDVYDFTNTGYLTHHGGLGFSLTDKCIEELNDE